MALKVRELLQPAAKERQRDAASEAAQSRPRDETGKLQVSADLREASPPPKTTPAEQRKSTAQAAKAVGASPRAVEQAARVEKLAPDLLPQVQSGTMALHAAHREAQQRERHGERNDLRLKASNISADLREGSTPAEQRKSTAQAAKATGAYRWAAVITS